ncbi:hypothetical protein [Allosphingosinicella vermicomposti]|uniref:hypothetical protein n=1 Tax=Allosphingosinicella vermicomposti TaxID=614671 RepID=UPI000D0F13DF|nr:hypothetical protein [Allosphingosinicella vermicomposti]
MPDVSILSRTTSLFQTTQVYDPRKLRHSINFINFPSTASNTILPLLRRNIMRIGAAKFLTRKIDS